MPTGLDHHYACACHNPLHGFFMQHVLSTAVKPVLAQAQAQTQTKQVNSLLISGGIIRPLKQGKTDRVDALGVHDGRVIAAGDLATVKTAMQDYPYQNLQLQEGQTLLPGFVEPHAHIVMSAMMAYFHDFGAFDGQRLNANYGKLALQQKVKEVAQSLSGTDAWLLGRNVDPALMPFETASATGELNTLVDLNCQFLDELVKDIPVLLMSASMHTAYLNTAALQAVYLGSAEIRQNYSDFADYLSKTQGRLQENAQIAPALQVVFPADPAMTRQKKEMTACLAQNLADLFQTAIARGTTFMYDAMLTDQEKATLQAYFASAAVKVRVGAAKLCTSLADVMAMPDYQAPSEYSELYYGHIKIVADGSNQGLTGYQYQDYCCYPKGNKGIFNFDPKTNPDNPFDEVLKNAIAKGWSLMIHANGDRAVRMTIASYKQALQGQPDLTRRHRIEHCSLMSGADISDMQQLAISPSFLIGHVGYWGYAFRNAIFEEKAEMLDLCKSALEQNLRISLHSDYSVSPIGCLRMMEQAITRVMEADPALKGWRNDGAIPVSSVLNPAECLNPEQALRAISFDAAWQCHAEQWLGSLEPGKFADFVILAQDPLNLAQNYQNLRNIKVCSTWIGGHKVYQDQ